MEINAQYDSESSKIAEKMIFSCERLELTHEDIAELKKKKLIGYVKEDTLPEIIHCQVLIFIENENKARIILFDPKFILPPEVLDESFLNKDLIQRSKTNWWFRIEFTTPVYADWIKLDFSYKIG